MIFRLLKHITKQGFVGMWRNRMMSFASISSVVATLLILGLVLIMVLNINNFAEISREQFDEIEVYIYDETNQEQIKKLGEDIKNMSGVKEVIFVSKEQALEDYKTEFGDDAYIFEGVETNNPLPNSYIVEVEDIKYSDSIVSRLEGMVGIERINYYQEVVNKVKNMTDGVKKAGIALTLVLILVSIFIISNTVKITVAARKNEISIMKHVGATNGFIRGPFIIEGMFLGIIGAAISLFVISYSYQYLIEKANDQFYVMMTMYMIPKAQLFTDLTIIFAAIGMGIGVLGSIIALKRFLKV